MALKLYKGGDGDAQGPVTNLTESTQSFVGRERELQALVDAFTGGNRLLTLIGAPGVGKTRLARELGRHGLDRGIFSEVWFCDLTDARTPTHLLTAIGTVLRATRFDDDPEAMLSGLAVLLQGRGDVLLILDNVEQLVDEVGPIVSDSLRQLPMARFLVTSREPLRLPRETRFSVAPLAPDEAVSLFSARASEVRPDFELTDGDHDDVRDLVERLDRFPLAIELAAARSTVLSPAQIRDRLDERFKLLRDTHGSLPRRQLTLRGALDWSWDMLNAWERSALAQCSVFRGGFTFEAADVVVDVSDQPDAPWSVDMLSALYDRSLLHTYRADGLPHEVRYALYASIRDYADEKLVEGEREAVEQRHAEFFLRTAEKWNEGLDGPDEVTYLARFDADRLNLMSALSRLETSEPDLAGRLVLALDRFFSIRETFEAQVDLFDRGISVLEGSEAVDRHIELIAMRGFHFANRGRTEEARPDIERAEGELTAASTLPTRFQVAMSQGVYYLGCGEVDTAESCFHEAAACAEALDDPSRQGRAAIFIGMVHSARADVDASGRAAHLEVARSFYERALRIFEELGSARHQSALLSNIGNLHARASRRAEQRHYYEAALDKARAVQHRFLEGAVLTNLSRLAVEEMRYDDATELLREALRIQREVGRRNAEAIALRYAGVMHSDRGEWQEAVSKLLAAADIAKAIGHAGILSETTFWLGLTQMAAGHLTDARRRFVSCRAEAEQTGDASRVGIALAGEAAALALLGETGRAVALWETAGSYETPTMLPTAGRVFELFELIVRCAAHENGDIRERARANVREVEADPAASTPDQRLLSAILDRLLTDIAEVQSVDGDVHEAAEGDRLTVGPELAWIQPPAGERIDLRRRRVLRRLVQRLVDERASDAGSPLTVDQLIEAGWPGQTFVGDSANSRVYVAIATLRELGLSEVLLTRAGGYLFDPHVELVVRDT